MKICEDRALEIGKLIIKTEETDLMKGMSLTLKGGYQETAIAGIILGKMGCTVTTIITN